MSTAALAAATTLEDFVDAARSIVAGSTDVRLHLDRIDPLVDHVAGWSYADWSFYLKDPEDIDIAVGIMEFVANAALNGGYFEATAGGIRKWEVRGSGSQALLVWIERMRELGLSPAESRIGTAAAQDVYAPHLEGQPFAVERLQILGELSDPDRRERFVNYLMFSAGADAETWRFSLDQARELARVFPAGFGGDPFMKKACLALLAIAGWLHHARGLAIESRIPIPSDYQIPRILAWKGVIEVSQGFAAQLRDDRRLLDVESAEVIAMRAAAVAAAHEIGIRAGVDDIVVDGALFIPFRKDPGFIGFHLPPMRCASMWF